VASGASDPMKAGSGPTACQASVADGAPGSAIPRVPRVVPRFGFRGPGFWLPLQGLGRQHCGSASTSTSADPTIRPFLIDR
jgi:hypothetical protein